ncbi:hypothetical protein [Kineococcus esterisolvens]|uniref:hypothetical protein n=1 Tax=unclassified Kineococcus TaxID=2621656 RepID=UPI003D7D1C0B
MTDPLLEEMLATPVGPAVPARGAGQVKDYTRKLEQNGDTLVAELREPEGVITEGRALEYLAQEGQDASLWEVSGFTKTQYGPIDNPMESVRFTFKRRGSAGGDERPDLSEVIDRVMAQPPVQVSETGDYGFLVLLGDMQFGKIDGDGVEGTLRRTIGCLDKAVELLDIYRHRFDIGHVHIAWLGDHIEGFVSQGGANVWRTPLTLNEQIRLTRRTMLHALTSFSPVAERLTMVAVPGNHGEAVRFSGKGITRYDDSHDTESLIAVADAAALNPEAFGHVEFFVPETDELTVATEVAGTVIAHAHGHAWRPGRHFDWWQGQAFEPSSALHRADLLVAGHLHHEFVDTWGPRTFIQPPSMESESTWFRHAKGTTGAPGLIVGITKDGAVPVKEMVSG